MNATDPTSSRLSRPRRLLVVAAQCLAAAIGGFYGFDFGLRVAGPWLGVLAALNTAFFAALFVSAAAEGLHGHSRPGQRRS